MITPELLRAATGCTAEAAATYAVPLGDAMAYYGINTVPRMAAFLAQVGYESGRLRWVEEIWGPTPAQQRYEGRADLGNTQPGDGERFKGRGLMQVTGRANYARMRDQLRADFGPAEVPDFEADPGALALPRWAAFTAACFWDDHQLNALADTGTAEDFIAMTRRINGGTNGLADRQARWEQAKQVLAAAVAAPAPEPAPAPHYLPPQNDNDVPADPPPAPPTPDPEKPMLPILPQLLIGLAGNLIQAFTPLAQEKLTKELARHTDKPEVAEQVSAGIVAAAQAATGKQDPIEAVAAAKASPEAMQRVEESALDAIAKLAPVLDRLAALNQVEWQADEASRTAAEERARTSANDQDSYLTRAIVGIVVGLLVVGAVLIGLLAALGKDTGNLVGFWTTLAAGAAATFKTRVEYRYGSSHSSAAKDAVIGELSRKR